MPQELTKALIIRSTVSGDKDRYVKCLTAEQGLVEAYVRGAVSRKSQLMASTEAFSLVELNLFQNKERYYVNQATFIYPFSKLKGSIEALTAASQLSDLLIDISRTVEDERSLYTLMARALYALEQALSQVADSDTSSSARLSQILLVLAAAETRLLELAGFALDFSPCPHCARSLEDQKEVYFYFPEMRFFCPEEGRRLQKKMAADLYLGQALWPLSAAAWRALQYFSRANQEQVFLFKGTAELEEELSSFLQAYLLATMEKKYDRISYLKKLAL